MTSSEDSVAEILADINGRLAALQAQSTTFTEINDRLHAENERLRRDEVGKLLQPVIRDLVKLADDWRGRGRAFQNRAADDMAKLCLELTEDVTMVLARLGVEEFVAAAGCAFDRHEHRAVDVRPTNDIELDGSVVETRRPGYRTSDKVVRFAEVVVLKYKSSEDSGPGDEPAD